MHEQTVYRRATFSFKAELRKLVFNDDGAAQARNSTSLQKKIINPELLCQQSFMDKHRKD